MCLTPLLQCMLSSSACLWVCLLWELLHCHTESPSHGNQCFELMLQNKQSSKHIDNADLTLDLIIDFMFDPRCENFLP